MELGTGNKGFQGLLVWQKADDLAAEVFRLSEREIGPRHRWLGLQLVRAAFSVTANISEGYGRSSLGDYARFIELAGGSLNEVENALHFIKRNNILPSESVQAAEELRSATGNLLFGLLRSLRSKLSNNGSWQRGLIREQATDYQPAGCTPSDFDDNQLRGEGQFSGQVPSSKFPDPEG